MSTCQLSDARNWVIDPATNFQLLRPRIFDHDTTSSFESAPTINPLTSIGLISAGKDLLRFRLLSFYGTFFPASKEADLQASFNQSAANIRVELDHVAVVETWKQYKSEREGPSRKAKMLIEVELRNSGTWEEIKKAILRHQTKPSVKLTVDQDSPASNWQPPTGRLSEVFADAATQLHIPRSQLESAFEYYAHYVETKGKQKWNVESLAKSGDWSFLAQMVLTDLLELGPTAEDGLTGPLPVPQTLFGERHASLLAAISACKERYFQDLQYEGPARRCGCGLDEYCSVCGPFSLKVQLTVSGSYRNAWVNTVAKSKGEGRGGHVNVNVNAGLDEHGGSLGNERGDPKKTNEAACVWKKVERALNMGSSRSKENSQRAEHDSDSESVPLLR